MNFKKPIKSIWASLVGVVGAILFLAVVIIYGIVDKIKEFIANGGGIKIIIAIILICAFAALIYIKYKNEKYRRYEQASKNERKTDEQNKDN